MRCADCRFAVVACKIFDKEQRIQKSKTGLVIRCKRGLWVDFLGGEKIYKTLFPVMEEQGMIQRFQKNCSEYQESQVPVETWKD